MVVIERPLPAGALLQRYAVTPEAYTDCLTCDVPGHVDLSKYVTAFYKSRLFVLERGIMQLFLRRPVTVAQAQDLAEGHTATFGAWTVEARSSQQLLLCDLKGQTRSWFMVAPEGTGTRLYFGSAVLQKDALAAKVLLPFHQWYARALLRATRV